MAYHPFRRVGLKLFSLALATLLWLTVSGDIVVDRTVRVGLEYQNVPPGLEMVGAPPATVDIRIRGASTLVGQVGPEEVTLVLDLSSGRPGTLLFHILDSDVRVPFGVEVMSVSPATVSLDFERTIRRSLPVTPAIAGEPGQGFIVSRVRTVPARVEVEGPESQLSRTSTATTDVVSIDGLRTTLRQEVNIGVVDAAVRLKQPRRATVTVELAEVEGETVFQHVPVAIRNVAPPLTVEVASNTVTVLVRGTRAALDAVTAGSLQVWVDASNLAPGRHALPVVAEGDTGYGIARVEPALLEVMVK